MNIRHGIQGMTAGFAIVVGLIGCSTPTKMSATELESIGVHEGARYWEVQQKLAQRGYSCYVSGAKRANFDCTRTVGVLPTCVLRITFVADDMNLASSLTVSDPACIGTP
jgi:hypothetical protein